MDTLKDLLKFEITPDITIVEENINAPKNSPKANWIFYSFWIAIIDDMISGAPLANDIKVNAAKLSLSFIFLLISVIIYLRPTWVILDPLLSLLFIILSLIFTFSPALEIQNILMNSVP